MSGTTRPTARRLAAATTLLTLTACSTAPGAWSPRAALTEPTTTTTTLPTTTLPATGADAETTSSTTTASTTTTSPAPTTTVAPGPAPEPEPDPVPVPRVAVALQAAPKLVVSPSGPVDPGGGTLAVGGTGYNPTKNNGFGIYVVFGPKNPNFWLDANLFLAAKWVHANPSPGPGQAKMNADGSFLVTLDVKSTYVDGNGATVDCVAVGCHVMTFAAHGVADRSFDVTSPITFGRATTSTTAAPNSSTSTSTPGTSPPASSTSSGTSSAPSAGASSSPSAVAGASTTNASETTGATGSAPSALAATGGIRIAMPMVALLLVASGALMLLGRRRRQRA